ncbi:unnamed protein product [Urochloa decumbens]|uniref:Uncharacterized protein n=1 Tax=Urochloa decumbens TaxID=240449 RepID=A0ABC8Y9G6_9POAL
MSRLFSHLLSCSNYLCMLDWSIQFPIVKFIDRKKKKKKKNSRMQCTRAYFKRLMESMGENVKFAIDEVCQGAGHTVAVMWHLEWNGYTIPFTKGCSFYIGSEKEAVLLIRKVHIFDESPLKPGKWALEILNMVTNLLNMFPKIAEGFLKDPEAVVQPFVKLYKFYVEPFILPFLAYYTHFWTYVARGLTVVLHILYNLFKRLI